MVSSRQKGIRAEKQVIEILLEKQDYIGNKLQVLEVEK